MGSIIEPAPSKSSLNQVRQKFLNDLGELVIACRNEEGLKDPYAPVGFKDERGYTKKEVSIFFTKLACCNAPEDDDLVVAHDFSADDWADDSDNDVPDTPIYFSFTVSFPFAFFKESTTKSLEEMIKDHVKNTTSQKFEEYLRLVEEIERVKNDVDELSLQTLLNNSSNAKWESGQEFMDIENYKKTLNFIGSAKVFEIDMLNNYSEYFHNFANKCYSAMSRALVITGDSFQSFVKVEHDALFEIYKSIFAPYGEFVQLPTELKIMIAEKTRD